MADWQDIIAQNNQALAPAQMAFAREAQGRANLEREQIPLIQQEVYGKNLQNQQTQLGLQMLQQELSNPQGTSPMPPNASTNPLGIYSGTQSQPTAAPAAGLHAPMGANSDNQSAQAGPNPVAAGVQAAVSQPLPPHPANASPQELATQANAKNKSNVTSSLSYDENAAMANAQSRYGQAPDFWTPQEQRNLRIAQIRENFFGQQGAVSAVQASHKARMDSINSLQMQKTIRAYQRAEAAYSSSDPTQAVDALYNSPDASPEDKAMAAKLKALPPDQIRQILGHGAAIIARAGQLPGKFGTDGIWREDLGGTAVPMHETLSLSPGETSTLIQSLNKVEPMIVNGKETPMLLYKALGYDTADKALMGISREYQRVRAMLTGGKDGANMSPDQILGAMPAVQAVRGTATGTTPGIPTAAPGAPGATSVAATTSHLNNPPGQGTMTTGPDGQPWHFDGAVPRRDFVAEAGGSKASQDIINRQEKQVNEPEAAYDKEYAQRAEAAGDTNTNVARLLNMIRDPNNISGPGSKELATLSRFYQTVGNLTSRGEQEGWSDEKLTQEITKELHTDGALNAMSVKTIGNQGLAGWIAKIRNLGAQIRLGAQETNIVLDELSPSTPQGRAAMVGLLNWQKSDAQYDKAAGHAWLAYKRAGYNPADFPQILSDNYSKENYVSRTPIGAGANAPPAGGPRTAIPLNHPGQGATSAPPTSQGFGMAGKPATVATNTPPQNPGNKYAEVRTFKNQHYGLLPGKDRAKQESWEQF